MPARPKVRFWKRPSTIFGLGVVVVLAIAALTDLPTGSTRSSRLSNDRTTVSSFNAAMTECAFALNEAETIARQSEAGQLTPGDRAKAPGLLNDDFNACAGTSSNLDTLANIEMPGGQVGHQLGQVDATLFHWYWPGASDVINDLTTIVEHGASGRALATLRSDARVENAFRARAARQLG